MKSKRPDFRNTEIAFKSLDNKQLNKTKWLFSLMNKPWLVDIGSKIGITAIKLRLPFAKQILKETIYKQFCAGETLLECEQNISRLAKFGVQTILDYGAEGKETEEDFNFTMNNTLRSIDFAHDYSHIPIVSLKITGLARFALLEKVHAGVTLSPAEEIEFENVTKRMEAICYNGYQKKIAIYVDAEETWIQGAIDLLTYKMMQLYNKEYVTVYNTFQMYTTSALESLKVAHIIARQSGYFLGAKIVRGAYMEKERKRAAEMNYPSPIHVDKSGTDADYNAAITYCTEYIDEISVCCATHNEKSSYLFAELLSNHGIPANSHHVMFSQLYGMSDQITFNLAASGFNASKYVVYGPVRDVIPYLIRRAEENTAVAGDMSREYSIIAKEYKRRNK